ncbi:MAG: FAD-dependent oxidoreductase, partial [Pseudomonadota bacterium]
MVEVTDTPDAPYELCVIGAGIAGLNALFVAQSYLPKGARVALVDRKSAPGGMWTETYDFVRLHQPHPMFTAGNIAWQGTRPRDHLASKSEVLDHFSHCVDVIRQHLTVESFFRHDVVETTDGAQAVTVRVRSLYGDGPDTTLTAHKVIHAVGYDVPCPAPLTLSSSAVRSATPQDLDAEMLGSTEPIYIAGGGKTAMDAALALLAAQPERQVTLLTGPGTIFGNRDRFMPKGLGRWVSGKLFVNVRKDVCERFDGTNEDDVFAYFRDTYAHSPMDGGTRHLFGLMSEAECAAMRDGATLREGYLADVEDGPDGPALVLRDGTKFAIPPGSVVLNCTGHLLHEVPPPPDILSPSGRILTISQSAT